MKLVNLPAEIIEAILTTIDDVSDLVSFTSTCRHVRTIAERVIDQRKQEFLSSASLYYSRRFPAGRWLFDDIIYNWEGSAKRVKGYFETDVNLTAYLKHLTVSSKGLDPFAFTWRKFRLLPLGLSWSTILQQYPQLTQIDRDLRERNLQGEDEWLDELHSTEAVFVAVLRLVLACPRLTTINLEEVDARMLRHMHAFLQQRLAVQAQPEGGPRSKEITRHDDMPIVLKITMPEMHQLDKECMQLLTLPTWKRLYAQGWQAFDQKHECLLDEWIPQIASRIEFVELQQCFLSPSGLAKFVKGMPYLVHMRVSDSSTWSGETRGFKADFLSAAGTHFEERSLVWYDRFPQDSDRYCFSEFGICKTTFLEEMSRNLHQDLVLDGWVATRKDLEWCDSLVDEEEIQDNEEDEEGG